VVVTNPQKAAKHQADLRVRIYFEVIVVIGMVGGVPANL
jgi:hypothetical protein